MGLSVAWGCPWRGAASGRGQEGTGAAVTVAPGVGVSWAGHKCPIVLARGGLVGLQGCPWMTAAPGSAAPQDTQTAGSKEALGPPALHYLPPALAPLLPACRHPPAMEEDIAPRRSCLPNPRGPTGPSRIPGPPPRRDGPLSAPTAPTKRSCLSVTLCRVGRGGGGPPWERLRGLAPVTPVPPRPRPTTAEGVQRRGGPGGAEAALATKMGVPCSPPCSGGSLLTGWDGLAREEGGTKGFLSGAMGLGMGQRPVGVEG